MRAILEMADDLDNEWWLEGENQSENSSKQDESSRKGKKRKSKGTAREHVTDTDGGAIKDKVEDGESVKKKKRRKRKPKIEDVPLQLEGKSVADVLWKTFCTKCGGKLTSVELEDLRIEESRCLVEETVHTGDATQLSDYLEKVIPYWTQQVEKLNKKDIKGSPLLLIVSSAAGRAVELNKSLEKFKADCKVIKLFAKHIKAEDQMKFLESKVVHLGIGTPNRVLKLIKNDALKTKRLKYVILDWTWRDQKLKSLMDIPEVLEDIKDLLKDYVLPLAKSGQLQVGLF